MRYFFHIRSGGDKIVDDEGTDLPNAKAVQAEAVQAAREVMSNAIRRGLDVSDRAFEIISEEGNVVATVPFRNAIRLSV